MVWYIQHTRHNGANMSDGVGSELNWCSNCKTWALLKFFDIKEKTGRRFKTCNNCRTRHKCDQCDYACSASSSLKTHIKRVHDDVRDFECGQCDYACSTNSDLKQHVKRIHDKIKDEQCPHCDAKFSDSGNLKRHIKTCTDTGKLRGSSGEHAVMAVLDNLGIEYQYDCSYEVKDKSLLRWDFKIKDKNVFIEYDGEGHYFPVRYGGMTEDEAIVALGDTKRRDMIKNDYCKENGYPLLRIPYYEKDNVERLISDFLSASF